MMCADGYREAVGGTRLFEPCTERCIILYDPPNKKGDHMVALFSTLLSLFYSVTR